MTTSETAQQSQTPHVKAESATLQRRLGGRESLAAGTVLVAGGAAFSWDWLVAVGIAPVILALLPCAAMCALGWCAMRSGASCQKHALADDAPPGKAPGMLQHPSPEHAVDTGARQSRDDA